MSKLREAPRCPRHPGSKVWLDGTYATARGRRRRYRCFPGDGEPSHRFTEPRAAPGEGHPAPRRFVYSTRDIARALADVGRGSSYREAARRARARADRGGSVDGNAVADWVEIFAPVLFARYASARWPAVLELDSLRFRARDVGDDEAGTAFEILAALTPPRRERAQIVALDVVPRVAQGGMQAFWEAFLRSRSGVPIQIVCDPDPDLVAAIAAVWPPGGRSSPTVFLCHRHLTRELLQLAQVSEVEPDARFYRAAVQAFTSPAAWRRFIAEPAPRRVRSLDAWVALHGEQVTSQLAHAAGATTSTELLEQQFEILRGRLAARRGNLRNRERTRRLLMLLMLDLNGRSDPERYEEILAEELLRRGGAAPPRRTIVDVDGPTLNA